MRPTRRARRWAALLALLGATGGCGSSAGPPPPLTSPRWLGDFETPDEVARAWAARGVAASPSTEHATHGRFAVSLTFAPGRSPSYSLGDGLLGAGRLGDWRPYRFLRFDLYNPSSTRLRLLVQVRDSGRGLYKEEIYLSGRSTRSITVRLEDVAAYVDLGRLRELRFFCWRPAIPTTIVLDAVRLEGGRGMEPGQAIAAMAEPSPIVPDDRWHLAWASSLVKIFPEPDGFRGHAAGPVEIALARGERESFQLVLVGARRDATRLRVQASALGAEDGSAALTPEAIAVRKVGYVRTREPPYPVTRVGEWPDPLPPATEFEVPPGRLQPVWITLTAPADLPPGRYQGTLRVTDPEGRTETLAIQMRVWAFTLPSRPALKTAFDFYRPHLTRAEGAYVAAAAGADTGVRARERLYYLDMLAHRVSPVLSADPLDPGFEPQIREYLDHGLTAFAVGSEGSGNRWPRDEGELARSMKWYRRAAGRLRSLELLDDAYVYAYDEPPPGLELTARVAAALHLADPGLRTLVTLHHPLDPALDPRWLRDVDIVVLRLAVADTESIATARRLGKELWLYVSSPALPTPSLVIDEPAIDARILPWLCWKLGARGLLYWCVNYWKRNPWEDPASFAGQNGNGSLYYPGPDGPVPSIRLELVRDGIEDYDYLALLRLQVEKARPVAALAGAIAEAERRLALDPEFIDSPQSFSRDPERLLQERRAIASLIERLSQAP